MKKTPTVIGDTTEDDWRTYGASICWLKPRSTWHAHSRGEIRKRVFRAQFVSFKRPPRAA